MFISVIGAGLMGRAIAYDLYKYSKFKKISIADNNKKNLMLTKKFLKNKKIRYDILNLEKTNDVRTYVKNFDIIISAVPYKYNFLLAEIAVKNGIHLLDLGGNNNIVAKQKSLFKEAYKQDITIIPDCGLAPGLVSTIVREIVEKMDSVNYVKLRVGGLPLNPKPPLNYQIVFSINGLINEYTENAIILDHGQIIEKISMTDIEKIHFPEPFGEMEAFLTSGGCSTLPYTYKNKIKYIDYKTIRYPGHCEKFKTLLDLGLGKEKAIRIGNQKIIPRNFLINLLKENLSVKGQDVVLLKILSEGWKNNRKIRLEYKLIDYYDKKNGITAMMRNTGYPISIIAQMIEQGTIKKRGVFCPEEIVPPIPFFKELKKRNIHIIRNIK